MPLSGTDDYSVTRDQIIREAFEDVGVATANEPLEKEDVAVASAALNALAMSWKSQGLHLWKRGRSSLTLVAGTYSYALAPALGTGTEKPMRLLTISRVSTDGSEVDLNRLTLREYEDLPNKTTTGTPVSCYFEPTRLTTMFNVWPVPDATSAAEYTIDYVYSAPIQDMSIGNEDIDFPNEWYRALRLNLAVDLAPKYGYSKGETDRLEIRAEKALDLALDYDMEDGSAYFQPDYRGMKK